MPIQVACALLGNANLLKSIDDLDDKPKLRHVICIDSNEDQFVGSQERLLKFTDENPNTETQPLDPPPCWTLTVTPATVSTTQVNARTKYSKFCFPLCRLDRQVGWGSAGSADCETGADGAVAGGGDSKTAFPTPSLAGVLRVT